MCFMIQVKESREDKEDNNCKQALCTVQTTYELLRELHNNPHPYAHLSNHTAIGFGQWIEHSLD